MLILSGNAVIGRDAELRETSSGSVCNVNLAFNYGRKGDDGKRPTQWVQGSLWGNRAEALSQYLTKGTKVCVVMSDVHIKTWNKDDGSQGHGLVGNITEIDLVGRPKDQEAAPPPPAPKPAPKPAARAAAPAGGFDDMDDDIPF